MGSRVSDFLFDLIVVSSRCVSADEFSEEACHEELCAKNHCGECDVEPGRVSHEWCGCAGIEVCQFDGAHGDDCHESQEEHE